MFYTCYTFNCTFNVQAFTEDIFDNFFQTSPSWVSNVIYAITLFVLLIVAMGGAGYFAKVNTFL